MGASRAHTPFRRCRYPAVRGMNVVWMPTAEHPARELFELVTDPRLVAPLRHILGPRLCMHRGICRPKLPGVPDAAFPFHQVAYATGENLLNTTHMLLLR